MKKIIVAVDSLNYKHDTVEFAITMANLLHASLEGLFLDGHMYYHYEIYSADSGKRMTADESKKEKIVAGVLRQGATLEFAEACELNHVPYIIRKNRNITLADMIDKSAHADLLVIHADENFSPYLEIKPPGFLLKLLSMIKCPAMLVPYQFLNIN